MLSIITPAYNNPDKLEKFLASVDSDRQGLGDEVEVIVVDDSSTVDLAPVTRKHPGVRSVRLEGHPGPAAARNAGAAAARGDYLIFFDSDVVLNGGVLARFIEHFRRGETAVAGEYDRVPLEPSFFARYKALLTESWTPRSPYVSVFALRAAGIRKDAFEKVRGFNEDIVSASVEDFEFGARLAGAGIRVLYDPEIAVRHHHPGFVKQMKLFYLRSRDWAELFLERGGRFDNWCASPAEGIASAVATVSVCLACAAAALRSAAFAVAAGAALGLYCALNVGFLKVVVRRRGVAFVPVAIAVKVPLAVSITLGFADGVARAAWKKMTHKETA